MEPILETIDLDTEESNELAFKIKVEGAEPSPAKVRLVCETGDMSYMFNGHGTREDGVVQFVLPPMKDKLKEGIYQAKVEVLIENRYFSPVQFQINFKKAVTVVAESVQVVHKHAKPEIKVSAVPIVVSKPIAKVEPKPIQVQQPVKQAPPSTKENASITLKERYTNKPKKDNVVADDETIKKLAKQLIRTSIKNR